MREGSRCGDDAELRFALAAGMFIESFYNHTKIKYLKEREKIQRRDLETHASGISCQMKRSQNFISRLRMLILSAGLQQARQI